VHFLSGAFAILDADVAQVCIFSFPDRWNAGRPAAQPRPGNSDAALLTLDWSTF